MPGRVEDVCREAERVVIKVVVIDVSRISVGPGVAAGIVVRITEADLLAVAEIGIDLPVALDPGIAAGTRIQTRIAVAGRLAVLDQAVVLDKGQDPVPP